MRSSLQPKNLSVCAYVQNANLQNAHQLAEKRTGMKDRANFRRVVKKVVFLLDEKNSGLTKRELEVVAGTHQDDYVISLRREKDGFWRVEIQLGELPRVYEIDTTRGVPKGWRHLSDAIAFVQENCPRPKNFFVEIGDWILTKSG